MGEDLLTADIDAVAQRSYIELLILASRLGVNTTGLNYFEIIEQAKQQQAILRGD